METRNTNLMSAVADNSTAAADTSSQPFYNPGVMLNAVLDQLGLKNDAALCRSLKIAPPVISKVRNHRLPVGAALLIRLHEISGLTIQDLRWLMGDKGGFFKPVSPEAMSLGLQAVSRQT